jgi:ribonuclease T2
MHRLLKGLFVLGLAVCLGIGSAQANGTPGKFDYYVLSLSWSPEYCESVSKPDPAQCGQRRYSLVVHGLWPQYENGGYPDSCIQPSKPVPKSLIDEMIDIMPSPKLIQHEWDKHGTCSGLSMSKYFQLTRQIYNSIKIPSKYQQPSDYITTNVKALESDLVSANPKLDGAKIAVGCKGRYLQEIQVCYGKNLQPRSCGRKVADKCSDKVILRPVR